MGDPIIILGIATRSGTNFLYNLLEAHPDCATIEMLREDFFLFSSDYLVAYADQILELCSPKQMDAKLERGRMLSHLGDAMLAYLKRRSSHPDKRLVTKTPSTRNVSRIFDFFPDAKLIILVRDGRAVAESAARSFKTGYEKSTRRWVRGAREIERFRSEDLDEKHVDQWRLVRYEDLVRDTRGEMVKLLRFLNLDVDAYDFAAAEDCPVQGSSVFHGETGRLTWDKVKKTDSFKPLERFQHWTRSKHERFNWLARDAMEALGYTINIENSHRLFWHGLNRLMDLSWPARNMASVLYLLSCSDRERRQSLRYVRERWDALRSFCFEVGFNKPFH